MSRIGDRTEMEAFVRAVDLGGFSAAARELGITPSALSKLVTRLERTLNVQLVNRTTRRLQPTPEGQLFLARCRGILAEIEAAESELASVGNSPSGKVRVHAGTGFGMHQLVPAMPRLHARYPRLQVELELHDHEVDIAKELVDVSIWPGTPTREDVVARKLCDFDRVICASPEYLAEHGTPETPDDLLSHTCIALSGLPAALAPWRFRATDAARLIRPEGFIKANHAASLRQLALMGLGIVRLNDFMVGDDIRAGRLKPLLTGVHDLQPLTMHVRYSHTRYRLPRVAAVVQFLFDSFAHAPWRLGA